MPPDIVKQAVKKSVMADKSPCTLFFHRYLTSTVHIQVLIRIHTEIILTSTQERQLS